MDELSVLLNETSIGTLTRHKGGKLNFEYDYAYHGKIDLSLSMPHWGKSFSVKVASPFIWNLLPDNDQLIRQWGKELLTWCFLITKHDTGFGLYL